MVKNIQKIQLINNKLLSANEYFKGIQKGSNTLLSKAITLVESTNSAHQKLAEEIIELCIPLSGKSIRIGITGVPGVGKSTFIEAYGLHLIKDKNKKVAVLAIDPSSSKSGGSILGDKTRMNQLSVNDNAFIRPSPSSGTLGGVAEKTRESIILCETAGYDTILIETVGVGQSETSVKSLTDFFVLLMLAGAGDELQGIKRGIMEMADVILINKADGDNIHNAQLAAQAYKNALHFFPANNNGWIPKVDTCSSLNNININVLSTIIDKFMELTVSNSSFYTNRNNQSKFWFHETINHALKSLFYNNPKIKTAIDPLEKKIIEGTISPFSAARKLLSIVKD